MKKAFVISAALLGAALVGGLSSAVVMNRMAASGDVNPSIEPFEIVGEQTQKDGSLNHFTAYSKENYPDLTYAAENAVKAVVNVEVIMTVRNQSYVDPFLQFFGIPQGYGAPSTREAKAGGSGVLISPDGYIVTNNHVVDRASKIKVKLNDGRTFDADIIGADPTTDVALLKVEAEKLPYLKFGSSDKLRLGEWVLAIGSPFDLQSTITAGIVSAKARNLGAIPNRYSIESFIQTDAAVNPGNSGGALVNTAGELVGINTLIQSQTGSYVGYSFAVPSSIVQKVVMDLKEYGVVQRALLGVQYSYIDNDFLERMGKETGITELGGVYVAEVTKGGAAEAAGIKQGDVIVAVDGTKLDNQSQLGEIIAKHRPNDKVKISVKREGKVKEIEVVLRNKAGNTKPISKDESLASTSLGGDFAEVSARQCRELRIEGGVRVTAIREGGFLDRARVRPGFIITHINEQPIVDMESLERFDEKISSVDGIYPSTGRSASYSLVE